MKINIKVRFKNVHFWIQVALVALTTMIGYAGITGTEITTWPKLWKLIVDTFSNPYCLFLVAVSIWNAIYDPTTKGLGDSKQALNYNKPKED